VENDLHLDDVGAYSLLGGLRDKWRLGKIKNSNFAELVIIDYRRINR